MNSCKLKDNLKKDMTWNKVEKNEYSQGNTCINFQQSILNRGLGDVNDTTSWFPPFQSPGASTSKTAETDKTPQPVNCKRHTELYGITRSCSWEKRLTSEPSTGA